MTSEPDSIGMDAAEASSEALATIIRDPLVRADPWSTYRTLRANDPVLHFPTTGEWLLTRFDDCEVVLRDPRFSSDPSHRISDIPIEQRTPREQAAAAGELKTLLFLDPPDHTRIRGLVSKAFTPRTVERLRPHIEAITDQLLDEAAERGTFDVVSHLGYQVPVTVICELMGVPLDDRHRFGSWASDASRLLDGDVLTETEMMAGFMAMMEFINYFNHLFDERRANPRDDLVSALLAVESEGERLSEPELRSIVVLLFIAGHETTMNLIGNGTSALLHHPDQHRLLINDPSLIGAAIEEALRYDGPVHLTGRIATTDIEVGGSVVRRGEAAITLLAAANRDPARFDDPDVFDLGRPDNRHLTFSHGIHYCLGAALARVEGQVVIGRLVERFPAMQLAEEPTYRDHFILRGLNELLVTTT
jgi:cytochrome P450